MKSFPKCLVVLFLLASGCNPPQEEPHDNLYESNQKAVEILMKSLEAHGDISSTSLEMTVHCVTEEGIHRGQSLMPEPPHENYVLETYFMINRPDQVEYVKVNNRFAGFDFHYEILVENGAGRSYDINTKTFAQSNDVGFENFRYFPHTYLKRAMAQPTRLVLHGKVRREDNETYWEIGFDNGSSGKLLIHTETMLLARAEYLRNYPPYGDGFYRIDFTNYARFGELNMPTQVIPGGDYGAWGPGYNTFHLNIETSANTASIDREAYKSFSKGDYSYRSNSTLKTIKPNLHLIENVANSSGQWSNNILLAEFSDHLMAFEAPINSDVSKRVMDIAKESFPDKPIRYLTQSHHHNDHWGGIREYIANGTNIIIAESNQALLERIAEAPFRLAPDRQWTNTRTLEVSPVDQSLNFTDSTNEVEIYDIGPTVHADHMLMAYFPRQKTLWQADMLNFGEWSLDDPLTRQLLKKIDELDLDVETIICYHGKIVRGHELKRIFDQYGTRD